jgi:hypothetical protein
LLGSPLLPAAPVTQIGCGGVGVALNAMHCGRELKQPCDSGVPVGGVTG